MSARDAVDGTTAIRQTNRVSGRVSETKGYSFLLADCRMFRLCELLTKTQVGFKGQRACGAGRSIKPGVERAKRAKPREHTTKRTKPAERATETLHILASSVARFAGSLLFEIVV